VRFSKVIKPNRSLRVQAVFALVTLVAAIFSAVEASATDQYFAYIGTYTEEGSASKGIYVYRFDAQSGKMTSLGLAAQSVNPSFLAIHPNQKFVYAVNEVGNYQGKKSGGVSAFAIDRTTGKLKFLNEVASGGADPCYITVDQTGKYVLVANYTGGSIASFPILEDGRLGQASAFIQHEGHGTNPKRQEGPHAHSIDLSPDNRFAIVDDLGLDETLIYKFSETNGSLTLNQPPFVKADRGAGPRHFTFSPNGEFGYVLDEMGSKIAAFGYNNGTLSPLQTISSLPKDFSGENEAAEIEVAPSGKFLYASNRGHDSIAVFAIDPANGTLTLIEYAKTQGSSPRNFAIDPTGALLLAANEKSDDIVVFRIDQQTGRLKPTGTTLDIAQPVCIKFVPVE
jgi:6-phosphogluconolactonase